MAVNLSGMTVVCLFLAQGPCTGNQQSLAHSRLWDAVVGFLHVFAHMQMKLSQVKSLSSVSLDETLYTVIIGKLNTLSRVRMLSFLDDFFINLLHDFFFKSFFFNKRILCKLTIGGSRYSNLRIKDKGIDYNGEIKEYSHQTLYILQSFIDLHFNDYSLGFSSSIHIIGRGFVICSKSLVKERQFSYRVINKQLFSKDDIHQLTGHLTSKAKEKKIAVQLGK